jgi:hypothetical protein
MLGIVGVAMALTRDRQSIAFPLAGTVLNLVDLVLAFLLTFGLTRGHH